MTEDFWYNPHDMLSHNAMITYLLGGRGVGKTYSLKKWLITEDIRFMWVRRYETELKKAKKGFLGDLARNGHLPEGVWNVEGSKLIWKENDDKQTPKETKGHFASLSRAMLEKSSDYGDVDVIVFDECLLGPGVHHYLQDEVSILMELIETVNRYRDGSDGRREVRVFCLGNKTTFINPHFAHWGIKELNKRFQWAPGKKGLVLLENYDNATFAEAKRKTKFGQLVDGTDYGRYSIDNEVWFDDNAFIEPRDKGMDCVFNIRYYGNTYGLWVNDRVYWFGSKTDDTKQTFAHTIDDHDGRTLMLGNTRMPAMMKASYERGTMRFEDVVAKGAMIDILQRYATLKGKW